MPDLSLSFLVTADIYLCYGFQIAKFLILFYLPFLDVSMFINLVGSTRIRTCEKSFIFENMENCLVFLLNNLREGGWFCGDLSRVWGAVD